MALELTEEETRMILDRRARNAATLAYNNGLHDAYKLVVSTLPASETRTEVAAAIMSLQRKIA